MTGRGGTEAAAAAAGPRDATAALAPSEGEAALALSPLAAGGRTRRENEQRILEAAEAIFAERGFAGATMAAIADKAGLPKANLHYYFGTKEQLYRRLLASILDGWVEAIDHIRPEADPAEALTAYIVDKMRWSKRRPLASKVFANEVIHGAARIGEYLEGKLRQRVEEKASVIEAWGRQGRMRPVDGRHLFFQLWALTQTYADFDSQVAAVLGRQKLGSDTFRTATAEVVRLVLNGCGLVPPAGFR